MTRETDKSMMAMGAGAGQPKSACWVRKVFSENIVSSVLEGVANVRKLRAACVAEIKSGEGHG